MGREDVCMYDVNYIDSFDFKLKNITQTYITDKGIKRKLNDREIEDFNLILSQNKYNL